MLDFFRSVNVGGRLKMDENAEYLMNAHSRKQITRTKLQRLRQT